MTRTFPQLADTNDYGWPNKIDHPKVDDLVVVTDKDSEFFNHVVRIREDVKGRQTISLNIDLMSQYGTVVQLYRMDVRPLSHMDKVMVV